VPPSSTALLTILGLALLALAFKVYGDMLAALVRRGGRVNVTPFELADLFTGSMLAVAFVGLMANALLHRTAAPPEISIDRILPDQLFLIAIVAALAGFLRYRGRDVPGLFGLRLLPPARIVGLALLFIVAAFPIIAAVNSFTLVALKGKIAEQPIVELFRNVARSGDYGAMAKLFVATVLIAPACEEFLFRGYFYGVGKRYFGSVFSILATSLLFAAFHLNLASLPGLFVLALCLNAAYERTGSLLVPMSMHAVYNLSSLVLLYLQAQRVITPISAP
jgi:membrane protease YdiL (CAAX protease family)